MYRFILNYFQKSFNFVLMKNIIINTKKYLNNPFLSNSNKYRFLNNNKLKQIKFLRGNI